ncbi:AAA family ATPase [Candidatus Dojkabacteria bacterium]|jgi:DNA repair exonuclease SbcCD ATPase subunit|nr:AAA family ATPase [Candidatus Dojkabacteria bacterium]
MRISLEKIRFRNILLFGNQPQEIDLKSGLNVIIGKFPGRTSSNKAGKSSFTDVISFALYGKVLKNLRLEQLINWRNKKNCLVEIDFTKGKDTYTIKRGLKPSITEVIKNGQTVPFVDKRDIQKQIEDNILGMNFNTFTNLVYTNINYSVPILKMRTPQKRLFMENLFGLETFTKLSAACVNKLSSIDKKINSLNNEIKVNSAVILEHNKHLAELSIDSNKDLTVKLESINEQIKTLNISSIDNIDEMLKAERHKILKARSIYNAVISKLEIYKVKEKHLRELSDKQGSIEGSYTIIKQKISDIEELIESHDTVEDIEKLIGEIKVKQSSLQERLDVINNNIISTTSMRDVKATDLATLKKDSACPLCRQQLSDYMVFVIIEREIEGYNEELKRHNADMKRVITQIKEQKSKLDAFNVECKVIKDLHTSLSSLNNQLATIESVRTEKVGNIGNKIISYYRVNNIFDKLKDEYDGIINQHLSKIEEYNTILSDHNKNSELLEEKRRIQYHIDYNNEQQESINEKISEIKSNTIQLEEKNKEIKDEITKLYKLTDYMSCIKDLCKDDKIKQHAIASIIPYLNKKTNEYLSTIGYNFYIELDKWVSCSIRGPGIVDGTYEGLSGGESRSVDIALMMAFHSIARLSSPNYFDIMILDELLDSSIDSSSIGGILDIIKAKQQEDNLKMFIVTHRQEINNVVEFDNVYQVERDKGYSKVSVL